jgi:hypothetical protein
LVRFIVPTNFSYFKILFQKCPKMKSSSLITFCGV